MNIRIIVDSTADIVEECKKRVNIVPLSVNFGDEEYIDGVTINHDRFYNKLIETDILPTTSQATPVAFEEEYEKAKDANEIAIVITLSSELSGTYQSAIIAKEDYENVYVIDSGTASVGTAILVEQAIKYIDEGLDAELIVKKLNEDKKKIIIVGLVDTLEYLKKGGRISKTAAFAGSVLNIKPVLSLIDGKINMLGKARGSKMGNNLLVQEIEKAGGIDFNKSLLLGYTGLSDKILLKYIEDSKYLWNGEIDNIRYTSMGSVIGTHVGPGAIVVAFFKKL